MTRLIRNWQPDLVADAEVAPHRYTWDFDDVDGFPQAMPLRDWKAKQPYQAGEVVYVAVHGEAKKARILHLNIEYDRFGDRRPVYRVQFETKGGQWAKLYNDTHPGPIQRGYKAAGLAPDLEGKI